MTGHSDGQAVGRSGTVFDIGYRSYTGEREGRDRSRRAVFKDGLRIALGMGRGGRAKVLPWFFISLLAIIGLVMAIVAGAIDRIGGPGSAERLDLPSHADFYSIASIILFVFAALVGPELLCRDRREGTINLYLVRPLTATDYIFSRWFSFLVVMLVTAWLPQVLLFVGLTAGDPAPAEYFTKHWLDIPRFLSAGMVMAVYATTLSLLTASFTTRRAYASVFLVGLFVITAPFTAGMAEEMKGAGGQWMSAFNLTNIPLFVNDLIFGEVSEMTEDAPARTLPGWVLVTWYLAWTAGPGALLWWRYRRLTP